MCRLPALVAALLLPVARPQLLGTAVFMGVLLVPQAPVHAQSAEAVAKIAQAITVRIEGATQGSGVLVKRDGDRYTVLTAWHVVSRQRPGEELDIYTFDGQRHQLEQGSIKRVGEVDMAVLTFSSNKPYQTAQVGNAKGVSMGSAIYVGGFPLPTSAVPSRLFRFEPGMIKANAQVLIPNGYQLLYSNQTLPGMSGGAALNAQGQLVGIHGQGETDARMSEQEGVAVKTGTNQAVPISYYSQYASGTAVVSSSAQATTADDYLVQAKSLLGVKASEQEVIRLSSQALATSQSAEAYFYRAYAKSGLGDKQGAIADYSHGIAINPQYASAYNNRGNAKYDLGDKRGAIADLSQAIAINPQLAEAYSNRGAARSGLGDKQGAIADFNQAIVINPQLANLYVNRGVAKADLDDNQGAIADFNQAIAINPQYANAYYARGDLKSALGDNQGAIADYSRAISIKPQFADIYVNRGAAKADLGDKQGAIADFNQAIAINPQYAQAYSNRGVARSGLGDKQGACADYKKAVSLGYQPAAQWLQSDGAAWCRSMP